MFGGELLRYVELADSVDRALANEVRRRVRIRSLQVEQADADSAVVALEAKIAGYTVFVSGVRRSWTAEARGPVRLIRDDGEWKVADLVVDEHSVLGTYHDRALEDEVGGLRVRAVAARMAGSGARLYLELDNRSGRALAIGHAAFGVRGRARWLWRRGLLGTERVEPGLSLVEASGSAKRLGVADGVRYVFETDAGCVDLRPPGVAHRTRAPLGVRAPIAFWAAQVALIAVGLGLFFHLLWGLDPWFLVGFELVVFGAAKLAALLRQACGRPNRRFVPWLVSAATVVVAGLGTIVADFGSFTVFGRIRSCFVYIFFNWWGLGLVLLYIAFFQVIARRPRRARRVRRPQLALFGAAVAVAALGALLVVRHGGFALLTPSGFERHNVQNYLRLISSRVDIRSLRKVSTVDEGRCQVTVWDAKTNFGRFWVLTNPYELYPRRYTLRRAMTEHSGSGAPRCRR